MDRQHPDEIQITLTTILSAGLFWFTIYTLFVELLYELNRLTPHDLDIILVNLPYRYRPVLLTVSLSFIFILSSLFLYRIYSTGRRKLVTISMLFFFFVHLLLFYVDVLPRAF